MNFPKGFHVTHKASHWSNTETTKELLTKTFTPYAEKVKGEMSYPSSQKAIVIWDTFRGQNNNEIHPLLINFISCEKSSKSGMLLKWRRSWHRQSNQRHYRRQGD